MNAPAPAEVQSEGHHSQGNGEQFFLQLPSIFQARGRIARHLIASVRRESKLKVGFVSLSAVVLWGGAFLISFGILSLLSRQGSLVLGTEAGIDLTDLIFERMLSVLAMTVFSLLVVSNILVSFATLYRSRETPWLLQAPLSTGKFFFARFQECVSFSSWALAFLGSPILLAYGVVREAAPTFYLAAVLLFVPFVAIPAAIGSLFTMTLVRLLAGMRKRSLFVVAVVAFVTALAVLRGLMRQSDTGTALQGADTVQAVLALMGRTQAPWLPSHWLAEGLLGAAAGEFSVFLFNAMLLVSNALMAILVATLVAERIFFYGWTNLVSADEGRDAVRKRGPLSLIEPLLRPIPEPWRSLTVKDLRLFWRDPAQWSQFLIFFGLLAIYLANIRAEGAWREEPFRSWIALLNIAVTMLVLATLTTRFVFPLISLEGRRFWILGLAPLTRRTLLWQKFWLSAVSTAMFTVPVAMLSAHRLDLDRFALLLTLVSVAATTIALSGLAVGLGGLYPNFEEDNPSRITSGMGGTLNFILSMVFVTCVTIVQGVLLQWRRSGDLSAISSAQATATGIAVITLLTLATWWIPMLLGARNLARIEV